MNSKYLTCRKKHTRPTVGLYVVSASIRPDSSTHIASCPIGVPYNLRFRSGGLIGSRPKRSYTGLGPSNGCATS